MGESSAHTVISYDDYALDLMEDGSKRGTFRTYTLFIDTHDVTLQHLTIENASGDSATHGQAIALYADGDRLMIDSACLPRPSGHTFYRTASRKGTTAWRFHRSKTVCPAYQWQTIL